MILRWTFSSPGRERAERLQPDLDPADVQRSLARITEWKSLELAGEAPGPEPIEDLTPLFPRLRKGSQALPAAQLHRFGPLARHAGRLRRLLSKAADPARSFPALREILVGVPDLTALASRLERSVSAEGEVLDTASPELARARRALLEAQRRASELLDALLSRIEPKRREESFVTLRDGRYVVSIRAQQREMLPGLLHGRSQTGQSVLIEPLEAVEANNAVAEGREEEKQEEVRILRELTDALRARVGELEDSYRIAGELDLVRAAARLALELRAEPPAVVEEGALRVVGGRHPVLAEAEARGGPPVVPLDLELARSDPVLLISGPNMGGKTVALKTVGLLVLMSRAGLHVPAAPGTVLPLVDDLFVDLGDEQSIERDLSTFAGHLRTVGALWSAATARSLVLLDELGGGTDPEEGAALAMALLEGMRERNCPTIATTHLTSLKLFAQDHPGMRNAAMEFDGVTLQPRFVLKMGAPGRSRAFDIARQILPPGDLLDRAEAHRSPQLVELDRIYARIDEERRRLEEERERLGEERERLARASTRKDRQAERFRETVQSLRDARDEAVRRAYREAERRIETIQAELEERAKRDSGERALETVRRAKRQIRRLDAESRPRARVRRTSRRLDPAELRPGAEVWLPEVSGVARVERVESGAEKVWVDWEGRHLEVPVSTLEPVPAGRERPRRSLRPPIRLEEPDEGTTIGREVDLRGMSAEEAVEQLGRFLDRAALRQLHQVRIVHGKGTGTLKREVERILSGHPLVDRFRVGEPGEGGWGVTVVDLAPSRT